MGLLGKSFSYKIKNMAILAVSRIGILKNQHKARAYYARSDVSQLLNFGYHDNALLRVEHWIKEQNMLDAFVMVENYCNFMIERAELLERNKECPNELKEAVSSLIFASSRCGDFPELHKLREILTSKFGKEFEGHVVQLHRNNRVNTKMIQKLSTRRLAMETRMKALKQIATEIGVTLHLEQEPVLTNVNKLNDDQRHDKVEARKWSRIGDPEHEENVKDDLKNIIKEGDLSDRDQERKSYKDEADAAKKASESESSVIRVTEYLDHRVTHVHPMVSSSPISFDLRETEERVIRKQFAPEESRSSQRSSDQAEISGTETLISNEHVEEDITRQDNNKDHIDAIEESEHFSEEITKPSYQVRRWNPHKSQAESTVNPIVRMPVIGSAEGTHFSKQIHNVEWKKMSVRTRRAQI